MSSRGVAVPDLAGAAVGVPALAAAVVDAAVLGAEDGATVATTSAFTVAVAAGAELTGSVVFTEGDFGASGWAVVGLDSWQAASEASVAK